MAKKVKDKIVADNKPVDKRTKDQRRADRLALRDKALEQSIAEGLPFDESVSAIQFEQDYEAAYKKATESDKAMPAAERVALRERIKQISAEAVKPVEQTEKTAAQLTLEAAKATLIGSTTEEPVKEEPVAEPVAEPPMIEAIADPMLRREGETKKAWKQRLHNMKKQEKLAEPVAETTEAPTKSETKSYPTGQLVYNSDEDGDSLKVEPKKVEPVKEEPKVEPVTEVKVEPAKEVEAKKPTLTVAASNNVVDRGVDNAKEAKAFYGNAYIDERSASLNEAYYWLTRAVVAEQDKNAAKFRMAMGSALKHEAAAYGKTITAMDAIKQMESEFDALSIYHGASKAPQQRAA